MNTTLPRSRVLRLVRSSPLLGLWLLVVGCGGASPTPSAAAAPAASDAPATSARAADKSPSVASAAPAPSAAPAAAEDVTKSTRSPKEAITRKDVVYMLAFEDSDVGKKAAELCAKESGGDPKKRAACSARERGKLDTDGIRFLQDTSGAWWWIGIKRKGNKIVPVHKVRFELGEETATTIEVLLQGKDSGLSPLRKVPAKLVYQVESDYQISTEDPQSGKLMYEVKIGIAGE